MADILRGTLDRIDDREAGSLAAEFIPTGFRLLDTMTGQFRPGQLAVVGARPSVGKSALLLAMARAAAEAGFPALVVSLEMSRDEHGERLLADRAGVRLGRIRGPSPLTDDDRRRLVDAADLSGAVRLPLWFSDRPGRTVASIGHEVRRMVRRHGLRVVLIDYLQLLRPDSPRDPRYLQVGAMSRGLKELARATNTAVIVAAQLNRQTEGRADGTPKLSDLRDSGEVEQDADLVMLLHRREEDAADGRPVPVDVIVAKNRNGMTGVVPFAYTGKFTRFEEAHPAP